MDERQILDIYGVMQTVHWRFCVCHQQSRAPHKLALRIITVCFLRVGFNKKWQKHLKENHNNYVAYYKSFEYGIYPVNKSDHVVEQH